MFVLLNVSWWNDASTSYHPIHLQQLYKINAPSTELAMSQCLQVWEHDTLYNNNPSKAIVNVTSHITYKPIIGADDTGHCTLIIWPIFGTRLISFTWSFKWENYLNSLSNKTVTISLDRQQNKITLMRRFLICVYNCPIQMTKEKKPHNPYLIVFLDAQFVLL